MFVALGTQHEMYMSHTVASLALLFFSTLSHKWYDLKKKTILHIKCVF